MSATQKPVSFLDNIISNMQTSGIGAVINRTVFDDYGQVIFVSLIILLIVLVLILYKYTFSTFNKSKLEKINYHKDLKLEKLPPCSAIPEEYQHRLCDYYIASSYNTPNINKLQLDYVSADMVAKALTSGARFIQLPVCSYSVDQNSYPVICQSIQGKQQITSLNTLNPREVFSIIRDFAFKYIDNMANTGDSSNVSYSSINYPLIIQLKLHTTNDTVLDILYEDISDILGRYLIKPDIYRSYPIQLEKLCNLLNKIIIISTPGYESSKLNNIIVPTNILFQQLDITKLAIPELTPDTIDKYYSSLSMASQRASYKMADNIAPYLKQILSGQAQNTQSEEPNNTNSPAGGTPTQLNINVGPADLADKLTIFNMIGLTLIEPDMATFRDKNINPIIPFTYGCQLVAMNYQMNDEYMALYIKIFQKSSFVLKPSGLRLPVVETEIKELLDDYTLNKGMTKPKIIPTFISDNAELPILLYEQASYKNKIVSIRGNNQLELLESNQATNIKNAFIVKASPVAEDLIMLVSAINPLLALTVPDDFINGSNYIFLSDIADNKSKLGKQSFYPEIGASNNPGNPASSSTNSNFISLRLYNQPDTKTKSTRANIYYLGVDTNRLAVMSNIEDKSLITFKYEKANSSRVIKISHVAYGVLKIFSSGLVALSQNSNSNTELIVVGVKDNSKGVNSKNSQVVAFIDKRQNKYISTRANTLVADKPVIQQAGSNLPSVLDDNMKFILEQTNNSDSEYTIMDYKGNYLVANPDGTLVLKKEFEQLSPAITNNAGNIIKPARISPALGSGKYFKIESTWIPAGK